MVGRQKISAMESFAPDHIHHDFCYGCSVNALAHLDTSGRLSLCSENYLHPNDSATLHGFSKPGLIGAEVIRIKALRHGRAKHELAFRIRVGPGAVSLAHIALLVETGASTLPDLTVEADGLA